MTQLRRAAIMRQMVATLGCAGNGWEYAAFMVYTSDEAQM